MVLTDFSSMVVGLVVGQDAMGAYGWADRTSFIPLRVNKFRAGTPVS